MSYNVWLKFSQSEIHATLLLEYFSSFVCTVTGFYCIVYYIVTWLLYKTNHHINHYCYYIICGSGSCLMPNRMTERIPLDTLPKLSPTYSNRLQKITKISRLFLKNHCRGNQLILTWWPAWIQNIFLKITKSISGRNANVFIISSQRSMTHNECLAFHMRDEIRHSRNQQYKKKQSAGSKSSGRR